MTRRPLDPFTTLLVVLLPVLLVVGILLGGHPDALPGPLRDALVQKPANPTYEEGLALLERDYFRKLDPRALSDASLSGVVASLGDRFSNYFSPADFKAFNDPLHGHGRFAGVGVAVGADPLGLRVLDVYADTPAARAGIHDGDLIVAVNGAVLKGKTAAQDTGLVKGPADTPVTLTVASGAHQRTVTLRRAEVAVPLVQSEVRTVAGHKLAWVELSTFNADGIHGQLREAIDRRLSEGARGIVLDLRHNGGGLLDEAVLVASTFIPEGTIVTTDGRTRPRHVYTAVGDAIPTSVPVAVLVDANTASASEIVTAALQDHHRATVVGTHTFGKGVFQEVVPLSNGGAMDITVGEYFTPNGRNLGGGGVKQGAGVQPDVVVGAVPSGGHDPALDAALRAVASKLR